MWTIITWLHADYYTSASTEQNILFFAGDIHPYISVSIHPFLIFIAHGIRGKHCSKSNLLNFPLGTSAPHGIPFGVSLCISMVHNILG